MQDLSYDIKNAKFRYGRYAFSIMLHGFINTYTVDPEKLTKEENSSGLTVNATGILTHGGRTPMGGSVTVRIRETEGRIRIAVSAKVTDRAEQIRSCKLIIHDSFRGSIVNLIDERPRIIPDEGLNLRYPEGWRDVGTPLLILKRDDELLYYRSLDTRVREKRFVFVNQQDGTLNTELIFEPAATEMGMTVEVPEWEIGSSDSIEAIYREHMAYVEKSYGLTEWEKRKDIPEWARQISLCAAIHCMHWTGYIFNTYDDVLKNLEKLAGMIDGKHILAYLPGWEGRYYYQYGDYHPDERLGGEKGFRRLCSEAKEMGIHVMPMFGINYASTHHPGFESWGIPSQFMGPTSHDGLTFVDFDAGRHYDLGYYRNLNPAAPRWQNRLVEQTHSLIDEFGFDGAFYDISAVWVNDSSHELYPGLVRLVERLREGYPDLLIAGEGWYDALVNPFPFLQAGHTDGRMNYHDASYEPMLNRYCRNLGHLCLGDPSRLSTGVHELGYNSEWRVPFRKGVIPTVTIVDGTMEKAEDRVRIIADDARKYADLFL